jgi:ribonuclease Z
MNEMHNALAQIKLRAHNLTVSGFSIAGLATYLQIPELDVLFDTGECPLSAVPLNFVFLTHAHGDHARCLPRHWQLRRMLGIQQQAKYFLPETIRATCEAWLRAEADFEGVPEEDVITPSLVGLTAGQTVPLKKDLSARAFPVIHRVPSLGYTLVSHKRKLKPEYAGIPGPELARLKAQHVDIQYDVSEPLFTFIGDCIGQSLVDEAHIWQSRVLVLEATFLAPGEEALAAKKGHTHLHEIASAVEHFHPDCELVLKHFSMRYSRSEIVSHVDRAIPAWFRPRVQILI